MMFINGTIKIEQQCKYLISSYSKNDVIAREYYWKEILKTENIE